MEKSRTRQATWIAAGDEQQHSSEGDGQAEHFARGQPFMEETFGPAG
jgi:hypothetical protein